MDLKRDFPILEYDPSKEAFIEPHQLHQQLDIPERCVLTFFKEVVDELLAAGKLHKIYALKSEAGPIPIYRMEHEGNSFAVYHSMIGAPCAAAILEEVIAIGCRKFIACGGAGVLQKGIAVGHLIVPVAAVRDEGTSYHYLPPAREVHADLKVVQSITSIMDKNKVPYIEAKIWTTDAFFRETRDKVALRQSEGCVAVEMECAALMAVSKFRNVSFGQILYGGDDLSCDEWDSRGWNEQTDVRRRVFQLAVESCMLL